ncbi:(Fe-S)-binding protein [Clostridium hydrogeniformans]|uniref:(Fe-S)-binding protein n=1 Tax=Clostridium hydrogeniformans TaxID=349933 RepID=UPI0004873275|nr:(Fe-S)-binding protein [Clostridium hydrogeniformans]
MDKIKLSKDLIESINYSEKQCIDCKKCMKVCPMMKDFIESPKDFLGKVIKENTIDKNMAFSCMLCNRCTMECPKDIDFKDIFFNSREDIFKNNKEALKELGYNTVRFHQKNSFSPLFTSEIKEKNIKRIFIPGCSLSSYDPNIILETYRYLEKVTENISILFQCCGKPTLDMGDIEGFKNYYSGLNKIIEDNNIEEVIVACENCYKTIKSNSNVKVTSLWEVIGENGVPEEVKGKYKNIKETFALHDPCPIREEKVIHESVRKILRELGVNIIEFEKNRDKTQCCGAGGMVCVTNNKLALREMNNRAEETEADYIVSYCESCVESMIRGGKSSLHILDFLFNPKVINGEKLTQDIEGTIKKWTNRYNVKRKVR